jgi:iron complex outermembrane recepter protein
MRNAAFRPIARSLLLSAGMVGAVSSAHAVQAAGEADLGGLSLEELGNIQVTSVSKRAERLLDAPASIYVITHEDIRRSGVTRLPDALRLAPNLQVGQSNASQYAISARGFNNIGNKLLVLVDGRTVYTPFYSGVLWDTQDVMLSDIDRIEVISGPGGSLWGANAMNGVINIITRSSAGTQGTLVSAGGGNFENRLAVRHGGKLGEEGSYRVYARVFERDNTENAAGAARADNWDKRQAGFRADWGKSASNVTLQGDYYELDFEPNIVGQASKTGGNLLARWSQALRGGSTLRLQAYYDHSERKEPFTFSQSINLADVELQHAFAWNTWGGTHQIVWGAGYRRSRDDVDAHFPAINPLPQTLDPEQRTLAWSNLFIQDEIRVTNELELTLGVKLERNSFTGLEHLPNLRLAWKPHEDQLFWTSLSRSIRAPARLDRDFRVFLQLPGRPLVPVIIGGPNFQSEVAKTIDLGYRAQPSATLSYSATLFHSAYDRLRSGQPPPAEIQNMIYGSTTGLESWLTWQPTPDWRLSGGWTLLRERYKIRQGSRDPTGPSALGNDPAHTWLLRSSYSPKGKFDFDVMLRHVSPLPQPAVPDYTAADVRIGWRMNAKTELSLTIQNAFDSGHGEAGDQATASQFGRTAFFNVRWSL